MLRTQNHFCFLKKELFYAKNLSDALAFLSMERTTGIEPASSAWRAESLPLTYIRMGAGRGLEPLSQAYEACIIAVSLPCVTHPKPKGRGFLVQQPPHSIRSRDVLRDFPKREFPLAQRYVYIVSYSRAMRGGDRPSSARRWPWRTRLIST